MILITGSPRTGKSTAIKKIISSLGENNCGGFWTEEIKKDKDEKRSGFKIHVLNGESGVLASVDSNSELRISRYGVNLKLFERLCIPALKEAFKNKKYIIIDEIGPMQLFSHRYKNILNELVNSGKSIIGTIFYDSEPWLDEFKKHDAIELFEINKDNRNYLWKDIINKIK